MEQIALWLVKIEEIAGDLYRNASEYFEKNAEFSKILHDLSRDEAWHYHAMNSALDYMRRTNFVVPPEVRVDEATRNRIESPFLQTSELLQKGTVSQEDLVRCIVLTEYSEWNHLFIYVMETLQEKKLEFQYAAAEMQHHMNEIETFLEDLPSAEHSLEQVRSFPAVWQPRILIVEDSPVVLTLLKSLFKKMGRVDTATNGQEALEMVDKYYYGAIISDVRMPVMDGTTFFEKMSQKFPHVSERFLFLTATPTTELITFFDKHGLDYLNKPSPINEMQQRVQKILRKKSPYPGSLLPSSLSPPSSS